MSARGDLKNIPTKVDVKPAPNHYNWIEGADINTIIAAILESQALITTANFIGGTWTAGVTDPSTWKFDVSGFLTSVAASNTYLTIVAASTTYLSQVDAASTYLTQTLAASAYLTQVNAASTYATQTALTEGLATKANTSDLATKQDKLTAGTGIAIDGATISATGSVSAQLTEYTIKDSIVVSVGGAANKWVINFQGSNTNTPPTQGLIFIGFEMYLAGTPEYHISNFWTIPAQFISLQTHAGVFGNSNLTLPMYISGQADPNNCSVSLTWAADGTFELEVGDIATSTAPPTPALSDFSLKIYTL